METRRPDLSTSSRGVRACGTVVSSEHSATLHEPGTKLTVLLEHAAAGDAEANDDLFARIYPTLRKLARSQLNSHCRGGIFLSTLHESEVVRQKVFPMLRADSRLEGVLDEDANRRLADLTPELAEGLPVAERIGSYRIAELVGQGGMATVYRAERADQGFEQTVALKFILPSHR